MVIYYSIGSTYYSLNIYPSSKLTDLYFKWFSINMFTLNDFQYVWTKYCYLYTKRNDLKEHLEKFYAVFIQ